MIPGTVNLIVADGTDDKTHLFLPDPFFRNVYDQSVDPYIAQFESLLPDAYETHYLDDWYSYHELLGEVHCGTNVERTPLENWWEVALHLVEEN
jgi:protein-arginine deiminase